MPDGRDNNTIPVAEVNELLDDWRERRFLFQDIDEPKKATALRDAADELKTLVNNNE